MNRQKKILYPSAVLIFILFWSVGITRDQTIEMSQAKKEKGVLGSGIIFLSTQMLKEIQDFYIDKVGCQLWLDQGSCVILKYGNMLLGFCDGKEADRDGTITFFFKTKGDVDRMYEKFKGTADSPPKENKKYRIYHFYTKDPEGRAVEFQYFMHAIDWDFHEFDE